MPDRPVASPLERWAQRLARAGLAAIVAVTFVTSFDAVAAVAADRGSVTPRLAWAIPVALDGTIVVGSAVAWLESLRGGRWHVFPASLVAVAGGLSVWANVAHASGGDPLARALAAVPPVALLATVELGAWQLRRQFVRDRPADTPATARTTAAPVNGQPPVGRTPRRTRKVGLPELRTLIPDMAAYDALIAEHGGVQAAADALGAARPRLYERKSELQTT